MMEEYTKEMALETLKEIQTILLRNELFTDVIGEKNDNILEEAYEKIDEVIIDLKQE